MSYYHATKDVRTVIGNGSDGSASRATITIHPNSTHITTTVATAHPGTGTDIHAIAHDTTGTATCVGTTTTFAAGNGDSSTTIVSTGYRSHTFTGSTAITPNIITDIDTIVAAPTATVEILSKHNDAALMSAVVAGREDDVRLLLAAKGSIAVRNRRRQTVLMVAVHHNHHAIAAMLLQSITNTCTSSNVDMSGSDRAVDMGVSNGSVEVGTLYNSVCVCIDRVCMRDDDGKSALLCAIERGNEDIAIRLINFITSLVPLSPLAAEPGVITTTDLNPATGAAGSPTANTSATSMVHCPTRASCSGKPRASTRATLRSLKAKRELTSGLLAAVASGSIGLIRVLLLAGGDVHGVDGRGDSVLVCAVRSGRVEVVEALLKAGACAHHVSAAGEHALGVAVGAGDFILAQLLVSYQAAVNAPMAEGMTALMRAAARGDEEMVQLLLDVQADLLASDTRGRTALEWAMDCDHDVVVHILAHARPSLGHSNYTLGRPRAGSAQEPMQTTTSVSGVVANHVCPRARLAPPPAYTRTTDGDVMQGRSALTRLAMQGNTAAVRKLLEVGVSASEADADGLFVIMYAAACGHLDVVRVLSDASDGDVVTKDTGNMDALMQRLGYDGTVVEMLSTLKDQAFARHSDGWTHLMWAAARGYSDVMKLLLAAGARVDACGRNGYASIHIAANNGHADAVDVLLAAGTQVDGKTRHGSTALNIAAEQGHASTVQLLLEANAHVHEADDDGDVPLFCAAHNGHIEVVRLLLAAKTLVDVENCCDHTPLHAAAKEGHTEIVWTLLLAAGVPADSITLPCTSVGDDANTNPATTN